MSEVERKMDEKSRKSVRSPDRSQCQVDGGSPYQSGMIREDAGSSTGIVPNYSCESILFSVNCDDAFSHDSSVDSNESYGRDLTGVDDQLLERHDEDDLKSGSRLDYDFDIPPDLSTDTLESQCEAIELRKTRKITNLNVHFGDNYKKDEDVLLGLDIGKTKSDGVNVEQFVIESAQILPQSRAVTRNLCSDNDLADAFKDQLNLKDVKGLTETSTPDNAVALTVAEPPTPRPNQTGDKRTCIKLKSIKKHIVDFFFKKREKKVKKRKKPKKRRGKQKEKIMVVEDDEVTKEEDLLIKKYFFDFYFFCFFLIIITAVALSTTSSNMFYFRDITIELFFDTPNIPPGNGSSNDVRRGRTLRQAATVADFWAFAETTMVKLFHSNIFKNTIDSDEIQLDARNTFYDNQLLGVPRVRQVRVDESSCKVHPSMQRFFDSCYYFYSIFSEDTSPIRDDMADSTTATAWVYSEASELNSTYYWGEISLYGGGGYYLDLGFTKPESQKMIKELKDNNWITKGTRAVFIDFNIYNANVNFFCICKIVVEFPPSGGVITSADFQPLKLIRYLTRENFIVLGLELTLPLFILYYTYATVLTIIKQSISYFASFWNYIDLAILVLLYLYVALSVAIYIRVSLLLEDLSDRYYIYTDFHHVRNLQVSFNTTLAFLLFLIWTKLYKFLDFTVKFVEFQATLAKSVRNLLAFLPMFLCMLVAFSLLAYLLFGDQVKSYHNVWASFMALLQIFGGEFSYNEIRGCNRILGPIFYLSFIFFIVFLALNMLLAIINDAYSVIKSRVIPEIPKKDKYFMRGLMNLLDCSSCGLGKRLLKRMQNATNIKQKEVFKSIRETLRRAGFSDMEITIFFSKYDINMDNILTENTRHKLMDDLELKKITFSENAEEFEIRSLQRRLMELEEKLEDIELNLQPVIDKVDLLLRR